jgi:positive regulator of sigma E activity
MKEMAVVCSSQKDFAQVRVELKEEICPTCSARLLCIGQQEEKGTITVLNPLSAQSGDEVKIEIPEGDYSKELIRLFGVLLIASLSGLALGYLCALFLSLPPSAFSLVGFLLGLLSGGFILFRYFRQTKKNKLYPVITDIIKKGDSYG